MTVAGGLRWAWARRTALVLGFGVLLRVATMAAERPYWLDEGSLLANINGRADAGLFGQYTNTQLAPPLFTAAEWAVSRALGTRPLALRLVPFLGGIAGLFAFAALARRALAPGPALLALGLFAVSDDLIYYSSELKPYMTDVTAATVLTLVALVYADGTRVRRGATLGLAAAGALAVWLSFPAAFVLAGLGISLGVSALRRRDAPAVKGLALAAAVWSVSFVGSYRVSRRMLGDGGSDGMQAFWAFAFPPWPPSGTAGLIWPVRKGLYLFVNPGNFHRPFGPAWSPWLAVALAAVGVWSLARRDPRLLGMLALPGLAALGAAYARLYPFHGRLLLFLVPGIFLLVAEGLGRVPGRPARIALAAWLMVFPTLGALYPYYEPNVAEEHNRHGDLRGPGFEPGRPPW